MAMWKNGRWVTWAVIHSVCDSAKTCPICWENDREIWRANDAQEWIYGGKAHTDCRCTVDFKDDTEIVAFILMWGYNRPP